MRKTFETIYFILIIAFLVFGFVYFWRDIGNAWNIAEFQELSN